MSQPPSDRPVVYTTGVGSISPQCQKPVKECTCQKVVARGAHGPPKADGIVRVSRDRRHRRGKTVTVITGVPGSEAALAELGGTLKRLCGSGGTVKDGAIEIQGDHRELVVAKLKELGFTVKLAGG